ncbi:protein of unknown function [Bradyrhizobium vignae]|uniref:Uncharacterized protein n=1 Tax=Bradyrhizobium vignae TaxID=1549949 RepID=A0A2U3PTH6_9BRAD|nr:protein of unknown function [Bradyrhizobium vignae]
MLNVGTARVDTHLITWVQADADEFEYTRRGATAHEIMAALGHLTLAEAERYTREADRRRGGGGRRAIVKLENHKANRTPQTPSKSLGKSAKTIGKSK